ncbi:homoserine/homoserine lactone efflux protein [Litoreibacter halocynthiae]|uniref:Homoserine/homoserine lactone efflux protein n=1 Tax=Litoreibacter halocynthiae TaxID=1242689 RepID=A0A4V3EWM8_9RHOB|nr:LysE family translocator [Litoreibacter halocynthiae]TDT73025.1 homoserine/homoserine lactone efflux protein [Litoreibacter halocynthiae]
MSWEGWIIFAVFWVVFVTTPGPNAVNCIQNGMTHGLRRALWGVLGILTQATLFLLLSAAGVTALLAQAPEAFFWGKLIGAAFLVFLGVRGWLNAAKPVKPRHVSAHSIYGRAFLIATINIKSVAGYFAAFTQFVQPDIPVWSQMWVIMPTALVITTLSYTGFTAIGAGLGRAAIGAVLNVWVRRVMALCFIVYGVLLGSASTPGRA